MPVLTATADATGVATVLPPYSLADGTYAVSARQVVGGVQGPLSAPVALSMPNPAKTATLALLARMSVAPPAGTAEAIYATISGMMAVGVWTRLDVLALLAAHAQQAALLNWINPAYDLLAANSPTWTGTGFKGVGTGLLFPPGYNPAATAANMQLNNAIAGVWVRAPSTVGGLDLFTEAGRLGRRNNTNGDYTYRLNDGSTAYSTGGDSPGLFVVSRGDAASKTLYRNGSPLKTDLAPSTTLSNKLYVLGGTSGLYSDAEISAVVAGGHLTDSQQAAMYAALRTYLIALGATS